MKKIISVVIAAIAFGIAAGVFCALIFVDLQLIKQILLFNFFFFGILFLTYLLVKFLFSIDDKINDILKKKEKEEDAVKKNYIRK